MNTTRERSMRHWARTIDARLSAKHRPKLSPSRQATLDAQAFESIRAARAVEREADESIRLARDTDTHTSPAPDTTTLRAFHTLMRGLENIGKHPSMDNIEHKGETFGWDLAMNAISAPADVQPGFRPDDVFPTLSDPIGRYLSGSVVSLSGEGRTHDA